MYNERMWLLFGLSRQTAVLLLLSAAGLLIAAESRCHAQAGKAPAAKDLVGVWYVKEGTTDRAKVELFVDGTYRLEVWINRNNKSVHGPAPIAKWKFDRGNLYLIYDNFGRGREVQVGGRVTNWIDNNQNQMFNLTLREGNRLGVKKDTVLLFQR